MRQNRVRDLTANLLMEVAIDIRTEPKLTELTEEQFTHKIGKTKLIWTSRQEIFGVLEQNLS